ncbi:MAG: capsule assembly Wzi family protein [Planctomycetota bacterium]|jgi:hypothetical protein
MPNLAFGQSSPNVSLDHPVYRFLEHLETLGLIDSRTAGVKPYSRLEVSRLLIEAEDLSQVRRIPSGRLLEGRIGLFHREFRGEVGRLVQTDAGEGEDYVKPIQSANIRYAYMEGPETPERDFGRVYNDGSQVFMGLTSHGSFLDILSYHTRPEVRLHFHNWVGNDEDQYGLAWMETYVKTTYWNVEVEGGFDAISWGQGAHDTLILSNNADSYPLVKLSNPMPTLLPWIFQVLGPIRTQIFLTRLDRRRTVRQPWLAGMKLSIKPLPFFEFGMARTFIFGGKDRPSTDWWGILKGTEDNPDEPGEDDLANQLAGFDIRIRLPLPFGGLAFYTEAVGEDEAGAFPYKWSFLHGVHLAGILPQQNLWLRVEWARTHAAAYIHGTYATGYTYRLNYPGHTVTNSSLGHHIGNRSKDIYTEIGWYPLPEMEAILFGDWEERKRSGATIPEEHVQVGASLSYRFPLLGGFRLAAEYRYRAIRNAGYVRKERAWDSYFSLTMDLQF